jgi:hypothetical protein
VLRVSGIDLEWNTLDIENIENAYLNEIHEFVLWDCLANQRMIKNWIYLTKV